MVNWPWFLTSLNVNEFSPIRRVCRDGEALIVRVDVFFRQLFPITTERRHMHFSKMDLKSIGEFTKLPLAITSWEVESATLLPSRSLLRRIMSLEVIMLKQERCLSISFWSISRHLPDPLNHFTFWREDAFIVSVTTVGMDWMATSLNTEQFVRNSFPKSSEVNLGRSIQ